jgi:predicted phosphodiesterase
MIQKKSFILFFLVLVIALVITAGCTSQSEAKTDKNLGNTQPQVAAPPQATRNVVVPASSASGTGTAYQGIATALLGRPTNHSVNVNVVPAENLEIFLEYRSSNSTSLLQTPGVVAEAGVPLNIVISDLEPDTGYIYKMCYRRPGDTTVQCSPEYSFHTQRRPGSSFVFDVQADSHLDERASGDLYLRTLTSELGDNPDLLIDLGDTFMTDKLPVKNNKTYLNQYLQQRSYIDTIGHSVPLFLVLGNHDGEAGYALDGTGSNIAALSSQFRKQYFPSPEPDGFYTGNSVNEEITGLRQDYYAWEWGDALFIVIDPFWYTNTKPGGKTDGWGWTLGKDQYQWLKQTLEESSATHKFVFTHHLVGGDLQGRGGTEYAFLYEWGGNNLDGSWGFDQHRPGWGVPIHQLLVKNNVTAVFHGHDHLFAKQELDGIIYQEVPQPATISSSKASPGAEYGYTSGEMLGSPGHLRINVSPESVRVDYIRSSLPGDDKSGVDTGAVAYSYTLPPRGTI